MLRCAIKPQIWSEYWLLFSPGWLIDSPQGLFFCLFSARQVLHSDINCTQMRWNETVMVPTWRLDWTSTALTSRLRPWLHQGPGWHSASAGTRTVFTPAAWAGPGPELEPELWDIISEAPQDRLYISVHEAHKKCPFWQHLLDGNVDRDPFSAVFPVAFQLLIGLLNSISQAKITGLPSDKSWLEQTR